MIKGLLKDENNKNIIDFFSHETYGSHLCRTKYDFYSLSGPHVRKWGKEKRPIPGNYTFSSYNILKLLEFKCIFSQNPFCHIPLAEPISKRYNLPVVNIFHTNPPIGWKTENFKIFYKYINVFITEYNAIAWTGKSNGNIIIEHGFDLEIFKPEEKDDCIYGIANDFINRWEMGFPLFKHITSEFDNVKIHGNTPGLSDEFKSFDELVKTFSHAGIFLNTTISSPLPMTLMEMAASGAAIVTTSTSGIPDYFDKTNSILFSPNKPEVAIKAIRELINDKDYRNHMGNMARKAVERLTMDKFRNSWEGLIDSL